MKENVYRILARHLSFLGMGYPPTQELERILEENFSPQEAKVALALPTKVPPLELSRVNEIAANIDLPEDELVSILENLVSRRLLFSGMTKTREKGYGLHQFGYGFPQAFFWQGEKTPYSQKMAQLYVNYIKSTNLTFEVCGRTKTKNYRYIPTKEAIDHVHQFEPHAVFTFDQMEEVIEKAKRIAVAHCACRVSFEILERRKCDHPLEVCLKYDELAEYVIDRGIGRSITKDEAREIILKSEERGLVHMVENAQENIKHTCNCCPCCCWSVGTIARRKLPRDLIVATYFIRETDEEKCTGCGLCMEVCPVKAITLERGSARVDRDWCIGCGLCLGPCLTSAALLKRKTPSIPPKDFALLHQKILSERGFDHFSSEDFPLASKRAKKKKKSPS